MRNRGHHRSPAVTRSWLLMNAERRKTTKKDEKIVSIHRTPWKSFEMDTPTRSVVAGSATYTPPSASSAVLGRHRFSAGDAVCWVRSASANSDSTPTARGTVIRILDDPSETRTHLAHASGRASTLYVVRDDVGREVILSSLALHRPRA